MSLSSFYRNRFGLSYELFPPKTAQAEQALFENLETLMEFAPDFVTCTYGAGGSTRDKTLDIVTQVKQRYQLPVASHLTCVGATVDDLRSYLSQAQQQKIDYIVALRGDPPRGESSFKPVEGGLCYANELVGLVRSEFPDFGIAVAGYPETHQEAPNADIDLANLRRKVDAGADVVITQLFYDNEDFFRFRDRYEAAGIRAPLVPGILPVTSLAQVQRIASLCKARLPNAFVTNLGEKDDSDWQFQVGVDYAIAQVCELVEGGVPGIHFYVLNKSPATCAVLGAVGGRTGL